MGAQYNSMEGTTRSDNTTTAILPPSSKALPESDDVSQENPSLSFRYLDDSILSNDNTSRDYLKSYTLHICMFRVNREISTPFLEYYFQLETDSYSLPYGPMDMASFIKMGSETIDNDDDDEFDAGSREFIRQCSQHIEKTLGYVPDDLNEIYRGFLENQEHIYAFFDFSDKSFDKHTGNEVVLDDSIGDSDGTVAIMDEIIHKKSILGKPIHADCVSIFEQYPFVQNLKYANREPIQAPSIGYLCIQGENQEYQNVYNDEEIPTNSEFFSFPTIDHELYGSIFVVSLEPLHQEYNDIVRVASFIDTENVVDTIDNNQQESDDNEDGFCFQANDVKLCASYNIDAFYQLIT